MAPKRKRRSGEPIARSLTSKKQRGEASSRPVTRSITAEARNAKHHERNKVFFGNFDVQEMILQLLPGRDLLAVSSVSRLLRFTVEGSIRLQKKVFMIADPHHALAGGGHTLPPALPIQPPPPPFVHPSPHLNDLVFDLDHMNVLTPIPLTTKSGILMGRSRDGVMPISMSAYRVFDPTRTPAHWHALPFRLHLSIMISHNAYLPHLNEARWRQESSLNQMVLTQPPVNEVDCTIDIHSSDGNSVEGKRVAVRAEWGVTLGEVWEEIQKYKTKAEEELRDMPPVDDDAW